MAKGGYQVISFAGYTGAEGEKVAGAYAKAASGKAILIEDFTSNDVTVSGFANAVPTDDGIDIYLFMGTVIAVFNIADDDTVTITTITLSTE